MDSQKPIIEMMKKGAIPGESSVPKHIETVMSNVFIFDTTVYKLYKNDNDFINKWFRDLSTKAGRFDFTQRDFAWNQTLSPSIYLELKGARLDGETLELVTPDDGADELIIVMKRVNTDDILFERLMHGRLTKDESFAMGEQFAEALKRIRKDRPQGKSLYEAFDGRLQDLREWVVSASEHVPASESSAYCGYMEKYREEHKKDFEGRFTEEIEYGGDIHSHNAVFTDGTLSLMDTFPPKEEWVIEHNLTPLYRMGADIWALTGDKELFEAFIAGYEKGLGHKIDRTLEAFSVIYASTIMLAYLYRLQTTDPEKKEAAERFHAFTKEYFQTVQA